MSGNRVEELEETVRELEATVEGLTDELIETKERLAAIEEETGIEPEPVKRLSEGSTVGSDGTADDAEASADQSADDADGPNHDSGSEDVRRGGDREKSLVNRIKRLLN
jgi:hypothetical protein